MGNTSKPGKSETKAETRADKKRKSGTQMKGKDVSVLRKIKGSYKNMMEKLAAIFYEIPFVGPKLAALARFDAETRHLQIALETISQFGSQIATLNETITKLGSLSRAGQTAAQNLSNNFTSVIESAMQVSSERENLLKVFKDFIHDSRDIIIDFVKAVVEGKPSAETDKILTRLTEIRSNLGKSITTLSGKEGKARVLLNSALDEAMHGLRVELTKLGISVAAEMPKKPE